MKLGSLKKMTIEDIVIDTIVILLMLCLFILCFYPFWNILIISLNDKSDTLRGGLFLYPRKFTLSSYYAVLQNSEMLKAAGVSFWRTVIGTAATLFFTTMLAYGLSKADLYGVKVLSVFFVFTMYFGGGLVPYYMVLKSVRLIDTFWVYIIPGLIGVYNMILVRIYMESLPAELEESARLDGANDFVCFFRVILPLCKPVLATIGLYTAVNQWNSWFDTNLFTYDPDLKTLQFLLVQILGQLSAESGQSNAQMLANATKKGDVSIESIRMATTIVATLPILIVYPFLQKYFVKGMMIGAVKS